MGLYQPPNSQYDASGYLIPSVGNNIGNVSSVIRGSGANLTSIPAAGTSNASIVAAKKASAGTINVGQAVYATGHDGSFLLVELAKSNSATTMPCIGVCSSTITDAAEGNVTLIGLVSGFDTSSFSSGDVVYVDASTAGSLTATAPAAANLIQAVGVVGIDNASTGTLEVFGAGRVNAVPNDITVINSLVFKTNAGVPSGANTEGTVIYDSTNDNLYVGKGGSDWQKIGGSTAASFVDLSDTPANYTSKGKYALRVNAAANAVEFFKAGGDEVYGYISIADVLADETSPPTSGVVGVNPAAKFADDADNIVYFNFQIPEDADVSADMVFNIAYCMDEANTTDAVVLALSGNSIADAEDCTPAADAFTNSQTVTVPDTADLMDIITSSDLKIPTASLAAGDVVSIKFYRDADNASDTAAGNFCLLNLRVRYSKL